MRAHGGKTPAVTPSPLDDAELEIDAVVATMVQCPSRKEQPNLKDMCLERDNHRCMITGFYNRTARKHFPAEQIGQHTLNTDLAHIIPFSMGKYEDREQVRQPLPVLINANRSRNSGGENCSYLGNAERYVPGNTRQRKLHRGRRQYPQKCHVTRSLSSC